MTNPTVTQIKSDIRDLTTKFETMRLEISARGKEALKVGFDQFFELTPEVETVRWSQYTPYFSDGDENIFSVHDYLYTTAIDEAEGDIDWWDDGGIFDASTYRDVSPQIENYSEERIAQIRENLEILKELFSLPDQVFKDAFDDHARITVTRSGFNVEECDHD